MDNIQDVVLSILSNYLEIEFLDYIIHKEIHQVKFKIDAHNFDMWFYKDCNGSQMPEITILDSDNSYPHIMQSKTTIDGHIYNSLCLYENGMHIFTLFSFEEKIIFIIEQLLRLTNMQKSQINEEFKKEFLYYWNSHTNNKRIIYDLFLSEVNKDIEWLDFLSLGEKHKCFTSKEMKLNDHFKSSVKFTEKPSAIYINIKDSRGIMPPTNASIWSIEQILDVLDNPQKQRISYETYDELTKTNYSKKNLYIIFQLDKVNFGCEIIFKNAGTAKLLSKLHNNVEKIRLIRIRRRDYMHLNKSIGNDNSLNHKKIAIVGLGSLGSYVATEVVRAGIKNIILIDGDTFIDENLMRHRLGYNFYGIDKAFSLYFNLIRIHPEVIADAKSSYISQDNFYELIPNDVDIVVFTVGSSDIQLEINSFLMSTGYSKTVIYCWLEGDGCSSHALVIDYSKQGCYQCLFTDGKGDWINNKANQVAIEEESIIRNGCGGTRIAYGNSILLQTTALLQLAIERIFSDKFKCNFLLNLNNWILTEDNTFYERSCPCCGVKTQML